MKKLKEKTPEIMEKLEKTPGIMEKLEEETSEIMGKLEEETPEIMEKLEDETPEIIKKHEDVKEKSVHSEETPIIIEDETANESHEEETKNSEANCVHMGAAADDNIPVDFIGTIKIYNV